MLYSRTDMATVGIKGLTATMDLNYTVSVWLPRQQNVELTMRDLTAGSMTA